MSIHIGAEKDKIAPRVIMPNDPNRAHYIADKYLQDAKLVNVVGGMLAYTGKYKDVDVTVFSCGIGLGSIGVYSYELFNDYDVESVLHIGTANSYTEEIKTNDLLLADSAYSNTVYDDEAGIENVDIFNSSFELNALVQDTAALKNIPLKTGRVHTTVAYYTESKDYTEFINKGCNVVEMETFSLLFNAKKFKRKATSLLIIANNLVSPEEVDKTKREEKYNEMIKLALESIIKK